MDAPVDPFGAAESRFRYPTRGQLEARIAELEREDARKAAIIHEQADAIGGLRWKLRMMAAHYFDLSSQ